LEPNKLKSNENKPHDIPQAKRAGKGQVSIFIQTKILIAKIKLIPSKPTPSKPTLYSRVSPPFQVRLPVAKQASL
jgi:hypothetical protein